MRYFTRGFISGAMSEQRRIATIASYAKHLSALELPPALDALGRLNLHDAYILAVIRDPLVGSLKLRFRYGDLPVGYADAILSFSHVTIRNNSLQMLHNAIRPSGIEVLATELDVVKGGFKYRVLLWPKGEVVLTFKKATVKTKSVPGRGSR